MFQQVVAALKDYCLLLIFAAILAVFAVGLWTHSLWMVCGEVPSDDPPRLLEIGFQSWWKAVIWACVASMVVRIWTSFYRAVEDKGRMPVHKKVWGVFKGTGFRIPYTGKQIAGI